MPPSNSRPDRHTHRAQFKKPPCSSESCSTWEDDAPDTITLSGSPRPAGKVLLTTCGESYLLLQHQVGGMGSQE